MENQVHRSLQRHGKALKQQSPSYLLEDPIERAKRWIEEQQAKQQALKALEEAKPKVETYDKLISNEGYVGLREMAKMLNYPVSKWHKAKWTSKGGMKTVWSLAGVEYVRQSLERIGYYNKTK